MKQLTAKGKERIAKPHGLPNLRILRHRRGLSLGQLADLTGLRRPLRKSYFEIAAQIKKALDTELGFTFSVGLAPNKVVAKIASKWQKPSGLTAIPGKELHRFLEKLPVEKVWGIGPNTTALLQKYGELSSPKLGEVLLALAWTTALFDRITE